MNKFLLKILYFISPFIVILLLYLICDPFKVVKNYETVFDKNAKGLIGLNKDYLSASTFEKNYKKEKYNSFILGNSRSIFYQAEDWSKCLDSGSKIFHFDASGESLEAIEKKIKFIDNCNVHIDNVLFVFDFEILNQTNEKKGHLNINAPQIDNVNKPIYTKIKNIFYFHFVSFKAFISPKFLVVYFDFLISNRVKQYMINSMLIDNKPNHYNKVTNELSYPKYEQEIIDGKFYNQDRVAKFFARDTLVKYSPNVIKEKQKEMLTTIAKILRKHNTNCKVVISPLYDQLKFDSVDVAYLKNLFGSNNVFDFSGKNKYTQDYHNYYETSHYRPHIAREIMNIVYQKN